MEKHRNLHLRRIREGLDQLAEFKQGSDNAFSPKFKAWKERITQSLGELFGKDHDYTRRFSCLTFWELRMSLGEHRWSHQDQNKFENDLALSEQILNDALEEFEIAPPSVKSLSKNEPVGSAQPIIVNVTNVLSQTVEVQLSQIFDSLKDLNLSDEERTFAEKQAKELAEEARGQQRWNILAKSLEALKALGKSVYQRVAIPILLEMLKKQLGL